MANNDKSADGLQFHSKKSENVGPDCFSICFDFFKMLLIFHCEVVLYLEIT